MKNLKPLKELLTGYRFAVIEHATHIFEDSDVANTAYARLIVCLEGIKHHGMNGINALAVLLNDSDKVIQVTTAAYLLPFQTARALAILREAAALHRGIAMLAIVVIAHWEKGMCLDMATGKYVPVPLSRDGYA